MGHSIEIPVTLTHKALLKITFGHRQNKQILVVQQHHLHGQIILQVRLQKI